LSRVNGVPLQGATFAGECFVSGVGFLLLFIWSC